MPKILPFLLLVCFVIVISMLIAFAVPPVAMWIGVAGASLFFLLTLSLYITIRRRENRSNEKKLKSYKHYGVALLTHGIPCLLFSGALMYRGFSFTAFAALIASLLWTYEGWRMRKGYKFFLPFRPSKQK